MWCKSCRQDVPGLVSPGEKCYCCARCGSVLQVDGAASSPPREQRPIEAAAERVTPRYDPWELNEQLRHVQRLLDGGQWVRPGRGEASYRRDAPMAWGSAGPASAGKDRPQGAWVRIVSWPLLALGLGIGACGAALVGLSLVSGRGELWRLGLPTVLAGQFALLLALLVQTAGHYAGRKAANRQVQQLDEQLETVRRTLAERSSMRDRR
ncbi:MAG TPA: hypothetical protein VHY20_03790 [Pirellulales bacterium]|jgi:hypothetical protein|nr:hypothetical protein [Pirellulales bacterium]